ncbi:MAG: DNA polymerase III subunit gamma/tau, partial [Croceibacterium sp.]
NEDPAPDLRDALRKLTGERWHVERGTGDGLPSLREAADTVKAEAARRVRSAPLVAAAFAAFPHAELIEDDGRPGTLSGSDRNWSKHA